MTSTFGCGCVCLHKVSLWWIGILANTLFQHTTVVCSVNNPQSVAKVSLSVMRAGSLLLELHYPHVSQKPNTSDQLEVAPAPVSPRCGLATASSDRVQGEHRWKVGAAEPPKQT